jgi:exosome complex RNA-binding protein Rrp42 (RNase PH superfamily)
MLSIAHLPISMSFYFVENNIFADATHLEEQVGLTRITITMNVYK